MWPIFFTLFSFEVFSFVINQPLEQKGYPYGIVSRDLQTKSSVYFPHPDKSRIESAELNLMIESSPLLKRPSSIKVFLNGVPLSHVDLFGGDAQELVKKELHLAIPARLMSGKFARLDLEFINVLSGDACLDQRMSAGLVRVTEDSSLTLRIKGNASNIEEFFFAQPAKSKAFIQDVEHFEAMTTLFKLEAILAHYGSTLEVTKTKDEANIIIRESDEHKLEESGENQRLLIGSKAPFIAAPFLAGLGGIFQGFKLPKLSSTVSQEQKILTRDELKLSPSGVATPLGQLWSTTIPRISGTNLIPAKVHLTVAGGVQDVDNPGAIYVYLGDELLKVVTLAKSSVPQYHQVLLPERINRWPALLRLELISHQAAGKCSGETQNTSEVKLLEDTSIEFTEGTELPGDFVGFAKSGKKYEIVISENVKDPAAWLSHLSWLRRSFDLDPDLASFARGKASKDTSRIIEISEASANDSNHVHYLQNKAFTLSGVTGLTFVTSKTVEGIQKIELKSLGPVRPTFAEAFSPDHNDFLILGPHRIEVMSSERGLSHRIAQHAKSQELISFFEEWRYLILGVAWFVLTILFLAIGKKFK